MSNPLDRAARQPDHTSVTSEQAGGTSRANLSRLLLHVDRSAVIACAERMLARFDVDDMRPPERGLILVALDDGAMGMPFHIGEVPVSTSHVALKHPASATVCEGGAAILRDDSALARAIAVLDAVQEQSIEPANEIAELLRQADEAKRTKDAVIQRIVEQTRVDFSVISGDPDAA